MQGRKELKIETHCVSSSLIIILLHLHLLIFYQEQLNYIFREFLSLLQGAPAAFYLKLIFSEEGVQSSVIVSQNSILISGDSAVTLVVESFRLVFKGLFTDLRFTGDFTSDSCFVVFCLLLQFF